AVDHVPDQLLVARDQAFESPRGPRQYRLHQFLVLAHARLDTATALRVAPYARGGAGVKNLQPGAPPPYPSLRTGAEGARPTRSRTMDFALFVPISMFFAIVLAIKVVVDA